MFKHYLKLSLKHCLRNKWLTTIKVGGLALGIASLFFIFLWLNNEYQYDQFHPDSNRIYRIISEIHEQTGIVENAFTPSPIIPSLKVSTSEVEEATRYRPGGRLLLKYKQNAFYESNGALADHHFFNVFHFPLIAGDASMAFQDPMSIVISESMAQKYFGNEDPVGKSIRVENFLDFHVTGVFKNITAQSHLQFDFLMSLEIAGKVDLNDWQNLSDYSYVKIKSESDYASLIEKMNDLFPSNADTKKISFFMQPIHKIHLHSHYLNEVSNQGHWETCLILTGIAILLFAITSMNYINLTLAKRQTLLREYGIRSTLGAEIKNLINQLLTDSGLHLLLSTFIAILIAWAFQPIFNQLTNRAAEITALKSFLPLFTIALGYFIIITLTLVLSILNIIKKSPSSLINHPVFNKYSLNTHKFFIIIQFILAAILMISAFISTQQIQYLSQANLGFSKELLISMPVRVPMESHFQSIKNQIIADNSITGVTASSSLPFQAVDKKWQEVSWIQNNEKQKSTMQYLHVDPDFFDVMKIELSLPNYETPIKKGLFINQKAQNLMQFEVLENQSCMINNQTKHILGSTKNFHYESLYYRIAPMIIEVTDQPLAHLIIKYKSSEAQSAISHLEKIWKEYYPDYPFEFTFIDQMMETVYQHDRLLNRLILIFTGITVLIACLGLLAITLFTFELRTKEIAIRKSIGASIISITWILLKQIIQWILFANIIAWPLAWMLLKFWLSHFAYAPKLSFTSFLFASLFLTSISVITMLGQTLKTANVNPASVLKYE